MSLPRVYDLVVSTTVIATPADVVVAPVLSFAIAVSVWEPAVAVFQLYVYAGPDDTVAIFD